MLSTRCAAHRTSIIIRFAHTALIIIVLYCIVLQRLSNILEITANTTETSGKRLTLHDVPQLMTEYWYAQLRILIWYSSIQLTKLEVKELSLLEVGKKELRYTVRKIQKFRKRN
jgi:hypothetical protein